jgi:soluble lytic murein transglycosylase-like protein
MKISEQVIVALGFALTFLAILNSRSMKAIPETEEIIPAESAITSASAPCLQLYYFIEKYAAEYKIPRNYAYGIAHEETGYQGPLHWKYNHAQGSHAGALGPMQIMPATAKMMWPDSTISKTRLRNDIEFNVRTSMKLLRYLHDRYGDWKIVFGCYNTGKKLVNKYALRVYNYKFQPFKEDEYAKNRK